jgi:predicted nucleotide-binding protein
VRQQLKEVAEITIWKDGVFGLNRGNLESLLKALAQFDFAVLVLTQDDLVESRGNPTIGPRDNVLLEAGMFLGRLGPDRTFMIYDSKRSCGRVTCYF